MNIIKPFTLNALLLASNFIPAPVFSQVEDVAITSVNGESVQTGALKKTSEVISIEGSWKIAEKNQEKYIIQIAINQPERGGWVVQNNAFKKLGKASWKVSSIHIAKFMNADNKFEIKALVVDKRMPLGNGLIDQRHIDYNVLKESDPVVLQIFNAPLDSIFHKPYIRIDRIDGVAVKPYTEIPYDVNLEANLSGEVVKKTNQYIQVVVQPTKVPDRWVMDRNPTAPDWNWNCSAYFGRDGWDELHLFNTYAIITTEPLPTKGPIKPEEWERYKRSYIIAISPEVYVRRTEPIKEIDIIISKIGNQSVDNKKSWEVGKTENITGLVVASDNRPLKSTEKITLFAISENENIPDLLLGDASLQSKNSWELPPSLLGNPGENRQIIAIISEQPIINVREAKSQHGVIFSDPVKIEIEEPPMLEIQITEIDDQTILQDDSLYASTISNIRGTLTNKTVDKKIAVWIFAYPINNNRGWNLIAGPIAVLTNKHWSTPPIRLGQNKESLILIAVAAPEGNKPNLAVSNSNSLGYCYSKKIHVTLR